MENDRLFSSHYFSALYQNKLLKLHTSGSTGECMNIYWDKADYQRSLVPLFHRRKREHGIKPTDRFCYFYTARDYGKSDKMMERNRYKIGFCKSNLTEERLVEIYHEIMKFETVWIMTQPSLVILLCDIREKYQLPEISTIRYIELTGEMLFPQLREKIQRNFSADIVNHYGSMEVNSIAIEEKDGMMYVSENVYAEVIDEKGQVLPEGEEGDICITTLDNYCMPMIRYRVGDKGRIRHVNGRQVLELTTGRINDYVYLENGEKANSYIFVRAVDNTNEYLEHAIYQFCVIQKDINHFVIKLVVDQDVPKAEIEHSFRENMIQPGLENAIYDFVFCNTLMPDDEKGKMKYFISEFANKGE